MLLMQILDKAMRKNTFSTPFAFCKLDRAVRFLNEHLVNKVELEDLLHFAEQNKIIIHAHIEANTVNGLELSGQDFNRLKQLYEFYIYGDFTFFKFGTAAEERFLAIANETERHETTDFESPFWETTAYVKGYWPISSWALRDLYFTGHDGRTSHSFSLGCSLLSDSNNYYIDVQHKLKIESIVIFSEQLEKLFQHLAGISLFEVKDSLSEESKIIEAQEASEREKLVSARIKHPTANLIYGLLALIYEPNNELLQQSTRLYNDLVGKLVRHTPSIDTEIMSERAFNELMQKVYIQRDKPRG